MNKRTNQDLTGRDGTACVYANPLSYLLSAVRFPVYSSSLCAVYFGGLELSSFRSVRGRSTTDVCLVHWIRLASWSAFLFSPDFARAWHQSCLSAPPYLGLCYYYIRVTHPLLLYPQTNFFLGSLLSLFFTFFFLFLSYSYCYCPSHLVLHRPDSTSPLPHFLPAPLPPPLEFRVRPHPSPLKLPSSRRHLSSESSPSRRGLLVCRAPFSC